MRAEGKGRGDDESKEGRLRGEVVEDGRGEERVAGVERLRSTSTELDSIPEFDNVHGDSFASVGSLHPLPVPFFALRSPVALVETTVAESGRLGPPGDVLGVVTA